MDEYKKLIELRRDVKKIVSNWFIAFHLTLFKEPQWREICVYSKEFNGKILLYPKLFTLKILQYIKKCVRFTIPNKPPKVYMMFCIVT